MPPNPYQSPERRRSRTGPIAALLVVGALSLYPLSEGLALRIAWTGRLPWEAYSTIYSPLELLSDRLRFVREVRRRYLRFCLTPPRSDLEKLIVR
jgi:hypothetical protein